MIFSNIRTDFNFIFGQFSVARKLILMAELSGRQASCLMVRIKLFLLVNYMVSQKKRIPYAINYIHQRHSLHTSSRIIVWSMTS